MSGTMKNVDHFVLVRKQKVYDLVNVKIKMIP